MSWSQRFGGTGGAYPFNNENHAFSLVAVRGRSGTLLDSIQCLFVNIDSGQYSES